MTDARQKGSAPTEGGGCPRRRCPRAGRVIAQVKISDLLCRRVVLLVGGEPTHGATDLVPAVNVREDPDIGRLAHAPHFLYRAPRISSSRAGGAPSNASRNRASKSRPRLVCSAAKLCSNSSHTAINSSTLATMRRCSARGGRGY